MQVSKAILKSVLKTVGRLIGSVCAWPTLIVYRIHCLLMGRSRALASASESLSIKPGQIGLYTRAAFYRRVLAWVGSDVYLGFGCQFSKDDAVIGDRVYIGRHCSIGKAIIEDDVMLADNVQLLSGRHQHDDNEAVTRGDKPMRDNTQQFDRVRIGRGAWIGAGAIVMANVGADAVVGAGAVVVKPVLEGSRVAGVPAKRIDQPRLRRSA